MSARTAGRVLLTVVLLVTVAAEVAFTWLGWTGQHIFNPLWHPHARFHAVQMSVCVSALSLLALAPLWRWLDARAVAWAIGALQVCWWGGEFVATAVPGTNPSPDLTRPNTVDLFGVPVYGNLFFAGLMIVLTVLGGVLLTRTSTPREVDAEAGGRTASHRLASPPTPTAASRIS